MSKGNLFIDLKNDKPTLIKFQGQEVELYAEKIRHGKLRVRIRAEKDVEIIGPWKHESTTLDADTLCKEQKNTEAH